MVLFTCFIQGSTIKFLVKIMNITLQKEEKGKGNELVMEIHANLTDNIMAGLEVINGHRGHYLYQSKFKV